ncbi:MAG: hypothetical protein IKG81_04830 [Bacteroidales bacterium]|nr:hypothetical protein [Bacteroidales bacterium]
MDKQPLLKLKHAALLVSLVCMLLPSAWSQIDTLSIVGTTVDSAKVYDGTLFAHGVILGTVTPALTPGLAISTNARYLDPNAGSHKPVVVHYTLSGPGASNYFISNDTLYADITPRPLFADSVVLQASRPYDRTTDCTVLNEGVISGIVDGDTVMQTVTAHFNDPDAANFKPVTVTHTLYGPQAANYSVIDIRAYHARITKRNALPWFLYIKEAKEYDGTDSAQITHVELDNVFNEDDVQLIASANFDSPEIGDNKVITAHFSLTGNDTANYFVITDSVYHKPGRIIPVLILDTIGPNGEQLVADRYGFCQGEDITLHYHILQGEPSESRFITYPGEYEAIGFHNFYPCTITDSSISIPLPPNCPAGTYEFYYTIWSTSNDPHKYVGHFTVNMPNNYLVQTFDDVISIDNSGRLDGQPNRFRSFQWLHNGELIPGATKPYYQEIGGLTGDYSLIVNPNQDDEAMVCPKSDFVAMPASKAIILLPSPVVTTTTVKLQGFDNENHTLQVYNDRGILLLSSSFFGRQHTLDLSALPHGTYLVTVDGVSAKTLKL